VLITRIRILSPGSKKTVNGKAQAASFPGPAGLPDRELPEDAWVFSVLANWGRRSADWPEAFGMRVIARLIAGRPHPGRPELAAAVAAR